ncbi:hypothetical protein CJJ07_004628 [Candidozyma auris]|nr:hypothetical protein CJJ07_004628 [[Candida] auris]QEL60919.1 hypothetical protein CJJ09_003050 [[Candida] auris]
MRKIPPSEPFSEQIELIEKLRAQSLSLSQNHPYQGHQKNRKWIQSSSYHQNQKNHNQQFALTAVAAAAAIKQNQYLPPLHGDNNTGLSSFDHTKDINGYHNSTTHSPRISLMYSNLEHMSQWYVNGSKDADTKHNNTSSTGRPFSSNMFTTPSKQLYNSDSSSSTNSLLSQQSTSTKISTPGHPCVSHPAYTEPNTNISESVLLSNLAKSQFGSEPDSLHLGSSPVPLASSDVYRSIWTSPVQTGSSGCGISLSEPGKF